MATKTGFAIIEDGKLTHYGLLKEEKVNLPDLAEDFSFLKRAIGATKQISELIKEHKPDKIFIEQTNTGKFRQSQKQLEMLHCCFLQEILKLGEHYPKNVFYVDTSKWRSVLKIRLSKEQREHNKKVKNRVAKGKITSKHLAVLWVNETYNLSMKQKDHDICDAICLSSFGLLKSKEIKKNIDFEEILKIN